MTPLISEQKSNWRHDTTHRTPHAVFRLTNLAFIGLDVRVDDHVSLESLFLDEALEAHVTLVGPYVGVDEDMTLHVG